MQIREKCPFSGESSLAQEHTAWGVGLRLTHPSGGRPWQGTCYLPKLDSCALSPCFNRFCTQAYLEKGLGADF